MSLPMLECKYITDEFVKESRNGNFNSLAASPVPMLRFVYELCWNVVRASTIRSFWVFGCCAFVVLVLGTGNRISVSLVTR